MAEGVTSAVLVRPLSSPSRAVRIRRSSRNWSTPAQALPERSGRRPAPPCYRSPSAARTLDAATRPIPPPETLWAMALREAPTAAIAPFMKQPSPPRPLYGSSPDMVPYKSSRRAHTSPGHRGMWGPGHPVMRTSFPAMPICVTYCPKHRDLASESSAQVGLPPPKASGGLRKLAIFNDNPITAGMAVETLGMINHAAHLRAAPGALPLQRPDPNHWSQQGCKRATDDHRNSGDRTQSRQAQHRSNNDKNGHGNHANQKPAECPLNRRAFRRLMYCRVGMNLMGDGSSTIGTEVPGRRKVRSAL